MIIGTKCVEAPVEQGDGIRICIMRRPPPDAVYDVWMPHLSPSAELLDAYYGKVITWEEYEKRFIPEVLDKETVYLEIVLDMAKKHRVTMLCAEQTPEMCHRRLTVERLQQMQPDLKVVLK